MPDYLKKATFVSISISLIMHGLALWPLNIETDTVSPLVVSQQPLRIQIVEKSPQQKIEQNHHEDLQQLSLLQTAPKNVTKTVAEIYITRKLSKALTAKHFKPKIIKPVNSDKSINDTVVDTWVDNKLQQRLITKIPLSSTESKVTTGLSEKKYLASLRKAINDNKYYPMRARNMRVQGDIWIEFLIYRDGRIEKITIRKSSGKSMLDRAAKKSIQKLGNYKPFPDDITESFLAVVVPMSYVIN